MTQTDIQPAVPDGDDNLVFESGETQAMVSFKEAQAIYNKLTGKTESISQGFDEYYLIGWPELETLFLKVQQVAGQYTVVASNENIIVLHKNDTKEQYSSFQRFRAGYNQGNPSPIFSMRLTFNILIRQNGINEPQSYKITVSLNSAVVVVEDVREKLPSYVIDLLGEPLGNYEVEYVDYVVARSFMHAIDEWYESLSKVKRSSLCNYVLKNEPVLDRISKFGLMIAVAYALMTLLPRFVPAEATLSDLASFLIWSIITLWMAYRAGIYFSSKISKAFGKTLPEAGITINAGTVNLLSKVKEKNKANYRKGIQHAVGELVLAVAANIVAMLIM